MQILEDYQRLHQIPELGLALPKTVAYICDALGRLSCRVITPTEGSVCAFFDFGKEETIAFRADTDALPLWEETSLPFASRHAGAMHACGHDGHTAMLLELARRCKKSHDNILLIFQPGEETQGGAEAICKAGILQKYRVKAIFTLHLWPGLPPGEIFSKAGVLMAASWGVRAEFTGKSVHIARHQEGADALGACCQFAVESPKVIAPGGLLRFGIVEGGRAENILCGKAVLKGSLRAGNQEDLEKLKVLCRETGKAYGCEGVLQLRPGYPAVYNDETLLKKVQRIFPLRELPESYLTTEDFSYYQKEVPGVYALLGVGDTPPLHSPHFQFDPALLLTGVAYFQRILEKLEP